MSYTTIPLGESPYCNRRSGRKYYNTLRRELYFKQRGRCAYCGVTLFMPPKFTSETCRHKKAATIEHVFPAFDIRRAICKKKEYIVLTCRICNIEKGVKEGDELWKGYNYAHKVNIINLLKRTVKDEMPLAIQTLTTNNFLNK